MLHGLWAVLIVLNVSSHFLIGIRYVQMMMNIFEVMNFPPSDLPKSWRYCDQN